MKLLLVTCFLVLLAGLPIYLLYWNLFRPVLIQRLKYRLFQCRDELRLSLLRGEISQKEKAYSLVELFCNKAISKIENVDFPELFWRRVDKRTEMEAGRDIGMIFESQAPLRHAFLQMVFAVFGAACANSPGILILLAPVFVFAVTVFWFNKAKFWAGGLLRRAFGSFYLRPC